MARLSRRSFLARSGLVGCSLAASPLFTPVTLADAPWEARLVTIILRGGMDGLDVLRPYGDADYTALRPTLASPREEAVDLNGFYAMHPAMVPLLPLWQAGELGFCNAVSTPYRDKRSHFDGQDLLEAGTTSLSGAGRDGWLNRMLTQMPGVAADTAYAIGHNDLGVLAGEAPVANWAPDAQFRISPQARLLARQIMQHDPAMLAALTEAEMLADADTDEATRRPAHIEVARFAAKRLRGTARIAAFSINGWDTHRHQARPMTRALTQLAETLLTLRETMNGPAWGKTLVMAMTEFGRTARENGTRGTDHGTGGVLVLAGGALRGGRVLGDWPGLAQADLFERRDLRPTRDVRAIAAWGLRGLFGLDRALLESHVFPGLEMGADPGLLL